MKRAVTVLAAVLLAGLMIAACSASPEASGSRPPAKTSEAAAASSQQPAVSQEISSSADASAEDASQEPNIDNGGSHVLVAYYSATGNTAKIARYITESIDADTFAVTPVQPYSDADLAYNDAASRVNLEREDESLRTVELETVTPEGWSRYDTVFVGYPIWGGIAAWPIDGFVSGNDWRGKTVIPFCTSASSGIGDSARLLAELAGGGSWRDGERFSASASAEDVGAWVLSLGTAR